MKASIVDLRYKMRDVLKALDKNEQVEILYHGKTKGILSPIKKGKMKKVADHPFFGMHEETSTAVEQEMEELRKTRHAV